MLFSFFLFSKITYTSIALHPNTVKLPFTGGSPSASHHLCKCNSLSIVKQKGFFQYLISLLIRAPSFWVHTYRSSIQWQFQQEIEKETCELYFDGEMKTTSLLVVVGMMAMAAAVASHDYGDALAKSILFFEGQRSGKLPPNQRMTWRKDSALEDGFQIGVSLPISCLFCYCF